MIAWLIARLGLLGLRMFLFASNRGVFDFDEHEFTGLSIKLSRRNPMNYERIWESGACVGSIAPDTRHDNTWHLHSVHGVATVVGTRQDAIDALIDDQTPWEIPL